MHRLNNNLRVFFIIAIVILTELIFLILTGWGMTGFKIENLRFGIIYFIIFYIVTIPAIFIVVYIFSLYFKVSIKWIISIIQLFFLAWILFAIIEKNRVELLTQCLLVLLSILWQYFIYKCVNRLS